MTLGCLRGVSNATSVVYKIDTVVYGHVNVIYYLNLFLSFENCLKSTIYIDPLPQKNRVLQGRRLGISFCGISSESKKKFLAEKKFFTVKIFFDEQIF